MLLFWATINAGGRVDSALKDLAIVMKQHNGAEEAIEAINSLLKEKKHVFSGKTQDPKPYIIMRLRCGRLDNQIRLLWHKLFMIQQGTAFNGKRTKTARS
ncbi:hypothetical protein HanHA89_Chr16g0675421 [Helianthus annuus]|nr:hypothetical protein HanHA89_Chr16g0675421 [Helianthus annuus]